MPICFRRCDDIASPAYMYSPPIKRNGVASHCIALSHAPRSALHPIRQIAFALIPIGCSSQCVSTRHDANPKKLSTLDAAAKVLAEAGAPLNAKEMIDAMAAKGYWTTPGGKTPHSTLYAAILREINVKGKEALFAKTERGKFAING